ncbi:hypothetical protein [Cupriavidus sp. TMH.W2]|uniref:hypothetical protein n=1 Tax=Cupriavidus sp. TMH.W2 TaxID=3434465 RepID=UPI003D782F21
MHDRHFLTHPPRQAFRIHRQRRFALYAAFGLLLLSGAAWLLLRWLVVEPEVQAPWMAWSMKAHGAAALAAMFLLGTIWSAHIRHAWMRRRNRLAGGLFAAGMALLVMTGYGLYYFNGEDVRSITEWLHWTAGVALGLLFWLHLLLGRRVRHV